MVLADLVDDNVGSESMPKEASGGRQPPVFSVPDRGLTPPARHDSPSGTDIQRANTSAGKGGSRISRSASRRIRRRPRTRPPVLRRRTVRLVAPRTRQQRQRLRAISDSEVGHRQDQNVIGRCLAITHRDGLLRTGDRLPVAAGPVQDRGQNLKGPFLHGGTH